MRDLASSQSFSKAVECFIVSPFLESRIPNLKSNGRTQMNHQITRSIFALALLLLSPALVVAQTNQPDKPLAPSPLAHTYSIVARDPETGQLGVAVQSN